MKKKIQDRSKYDVHLANQPETLEPLLNEVYANMKRNIPKGCVILQAVIETAQNDSDFVRDKISVITTYYVIRAPRIVSRLRVYQNFGKTKPNNYI
jgi:hypothetical protein